MRRGLTDSVILSGTTQRCSRRISSKHYRSLDFVAKAPSLKMRTFRAGFTLIELSIALVIIGLVIGGILVGKDLIKAAQLRAAGSQINSYQLAVNTFRLKYNAIPGDIAASKAQQFGFVSRGWVSGDGNSLIQCLGGYPLGTSVISCEHGLFWRDLSFAGLIPETFNTATDGITATGSTTEYWDTYMPRSKLATNYIYPWSGGVGGPNPNNGKNYFGMSLPWSNGTYFYSGPGLLAIDAKQLDDKFDDGMPQTGKITAMYPYHGYGVWSSGFNGGAWGGGASTGAAAPANPYSCYDNGNNASNPMQYTTSIGQDIIKCALSFEMQ